MSQSSAKAIIDWGSFSIGSGGTVSFQNRSGATLNRVTGASVSAIDGLLSATGSVYLINPNGVIVGKTGVVNVGGSFVASTLDVDNAAFLAGGPLTFAGPSTASVVNLGKVGSLGGDVALIATTVANAGSISAANGAAGLLSGSSVVMTDASLDGGRFAVALPAAGGSVTNSGAIAAATAELRANGGDVYALAGDTAGVIRATGVSAGGGKIWLVAEGGTAKVAGTLEAQGANGAAGAIETSGDQVLVGAAAIDAHGGTWTLDPNDLTIDQPAADTIASTLNAGTSVTQTTSANGTGGSGDITVNPNVSLGWTTSAALTLSAYRNIAIGAGATLTSTAAGAVTLYADNTGTGVGTVSFGSGAGVSTSGAVSLYYNPASNPASSAINPTSYTSPTNYAPFVTGGGALTAYMLVNTVNDLQDIQNNLTGTYALGRSIDASATSGWNGGAGFQPLASSATPFTGLLDGQGRAVAGLTISQTANQTSSDNIGLFAQLNGTVQNLNLTAEVVTGRFTVGGLAGSTGANVAIHSVTVAGTIKGAGSVGGLVGQGICCSTTSTGATTDIINDSSFSGTVIGTATGGLGGIAGGWYGTLSRVHSQGSVLGTRADTGHLGGIAGSFGNGVIDSSYSSSTVTGVSSSIAAGAGGLVGFFLDSSSYAGHGIISNSYSSGSVSIPLYAGGLVGYNYGILVNDYSTSAVFGRQNLGGLVASSYLGSISNSYATGPITVQGDCSQGCSNYGGLVGISYGGVIQNSYWDSRTTGRDSAVGANQNGTLVVNVVPIGGSSQPNPYAQATYANLDFSASGSWVIYEGSTRPILRSEYSTTITNAHQLQLMWLGVGASYALGGSVELGETSSASGVFNPATGFLPVGAAASPFVGTLDGAGYTLSNLTINRPTATSVGLFGVLGAAGLVRNLTVSGAVTGGGRVGVLAGDIFGSASGVTVLGSLAGGSVAGGLAGVTWSGSSLVNAFSGAAVVGSGDSTGGLVGVNYGSISFGTDRGSVTAASNDKVGGLVGYNTGTIYGSAVTGAVNGRYLVGGMVGYNLGAISGSSGFGAATGAGYVGGLVGLNDAGGTVSGSTASGWVISASSYAGGLVAINNGAITGGRSSQGQVSGLTYVGGFVGVNAGTISGAATASNPVSGGDAVGGFAGENDGSIAGATGSGTVSGGNYVGGLVGFNTGSVSLSTGAGAVTGSADKIGGLSGYNTGTIYGSAAYGAVSGRYLVGGLVGLNYGAITGSSGFGAVIGASYLGGLAGWNTGGGTISGSTASGSVATGGGNYVGGLAGVNEGSITGSRSGQGQVSGVSYVGGLVGLNTASGGVSGSRSANAVAASGDAVGGLVGENDGAISGGARATGAVTGRGNVGGLVGFNNGGSVADSEADGAVNGTSDDVGGLIGANVNGAVTNLIATGAVTGTNAQRTGGLIGYNAGASVSNGYASGAVSTGGGLIGTNTGQGATLTNLYWDLGTTGRSVGVVVEQGQESSVAGVGGGSGVDPTAASSYPGFDFTNHWTAHPGASRPSLKQVDSNTGS